jgi:hypothetical protein
VGTTTPSFSLLMSHPIIVHLIRSGVLNVIAFVVIALVGKRCYSACGIGTSSLSPCLFWGCLLQYQLDQELEPFSNIGQCWEQKEEERGGVKPKPWTPGIWVLCA